MENAYAQALWKLVDAGNEPASAVRLVKEALMRSGRTALWPRIARAFARIAERSRKAQPMLFIGNPATRAAMLADATAKLALSKDILVRIDESLIGGWRYEERGRLVDMSYKSHLLDIYNRATR